MIKNFLKNVDIEQIKDQVGELREQVQDLHFRKPWTRGNETSPFLYMVIGASLAWVGAALYKNRTEVGKFCSTCGAKLKDSWEESGLKEKTERIFNRAKEKAQGMDGAPRSGGKSEAYYPT